MKRFFLIILLAGLFFPLVSFGASYNAYEDNGKTIIYDGLVPCGKEVCVYNSTNPALVDDFLKLLKAFDVDHQDFTFEENCKGLGAEWKSNSCELCHFFVMINGIIVWFFKVAAVIAVLMMVIGGVMFFFGGVKPDMLTKARNIITSVVIGLLIIFCAWVIITTVISQLGIVKSSSLLQWYNIGCEK